METRFLFLSLVSLCLVNVYTHMHSIDTNTYNRNIVSCRLFYKYYNIENMYHQYEVGCNESMPFQVNILLLICCCTWAVFYVTSTIRCVNNQ